MGVGGRAVGLGVALGAADCGVGRWHPESSSMTINRTGKKKRLFMGILLIGILPLGNSCCLARVKLVNDG
jgi:hypothetical protein